MTVTHVSIRQRVYADGVRFSEFFISYYETGVTRVAYSRPNAFVPDTPPQRALVAQQFLRRHKHLRTA